MHGVSEGVDKEVGARLVGTTRLARERLRVGGRSARRRLARKELRRLRGGPPLPSFTPARPSSKQPDF